MPKCIGCWKLRRGLFTQGGIVLKPVNNSTTKPSETKSWFDSFWSSVKTFWEAICRGVGWC